MERDNLLLAQFYIPAIHWNFHTCPIAPVLQALAQEEAEHVPSSTFGCGVQWSISSDPTMCGPEQMKYLLERGCHGQIDRFPECIWHGLASWWFLYVSDAMPCAAREVLSALTTPYLRIPLLLHFLAADRLHALKQTQLSCIRAWDLTSRNWFYRHLLLVVVIAGLCIPVPHSFRNFCVWSGFQSSHVESARSAATSPINEPWEGIR